MTDALLKAAVAAGGSTAARAFATVLAQSGPNATVRKLALERLLDEAGRRSTAKRPRFRVERRQVAVPETTIPARVSFWDDGQTIRAAAIDEAATVPERLVGVGRDVVDDLIAKTTDPAADDVDELGRLLQRLLVPTEFRDMLRSGSLVFEVDRRSRAFTGRCSRTWPGVTATWFRSPSASRSRGRCGRRTARRPRDRRARRATFAPS